MQVAKIKEVYKEYQGVFNDIEYPELNEDNYIYVHDVDFLFEFKSTELYEQNYKMYINTEALIFPDQYVEGLLFHEFTHLYDAIKLRNNPNYNDIMCTYSEIHASYVMMQKLTDFRESLSFNSKICIENTTTTIKKYFEHQLKMIIENNQLFPNDINILLDRILTLTYFIGEFIFANSIDQSIVFNIDSPYKDEVFDMIENYPDNPNGIAEAYLNILEKYKQHRRIVLANDFSKMINGAFSPEELIKKAENI